MIINGRFLAANPTGVQRVASELCAQIDRRLSDAQARDWVLLRPQGSRQLGLNRLHERPLKPLSGQAWEQFSLPYASRGHTLLSLCNTAPLGYRRNAVMIHDAQVYLTPQSYSAAFRRWYHFMLPQIGRRALKVMTVSEYSKAQLIRFGVATKERITVVPNGADHLLRAPASEAALRRLGLGARPYVIAMGSAQAHKNIKVLLSAFERPELRGVELVLAGTAGPDDYAAVGLHLDASVRLTGRIDDPELAGLMRGASALAMPSLTEGFGLPPLEAMSLGCPVVVAPEGALPEVCGHAATYADAKDAQAWALALAELIENPKAADASRARGLDQARRYSWSASGKKLMQTLQQLEQV